MKYKIEDGITQSILGSQVHCRQLGDYILNEWEYPGENRAMEWGNIFHRLDQIWGEEISEMQKSKKKYQIDHLKIFRKVEREYTKEAGKRMMNMDHVQEDFAMAEAVWDHYCDFWEKDDMKTRWMGLESTFDVNFNGYRLRGQRDGVFETAKRKLWLKETKTKGRIPNQTTLMSLLGFDFQNLFYLTASEVETGRKIEGVLYNIVRRPGLERKDDSLIEYYNRIFDHIDKDPEHYFKRYEIFYPRSVIEHFQNEELPAKLKEFEMWINGEIATFRDQRSCQGLWNCKFIRACDQNNMDGYNQTATLFRELGG